jgi:hypothetical protein
MDQSTEFPSVESQHRMQPSDVHREAGKLFKDRRTRRMLLPKHRVGIMQAPGSARVRSGIRTGRTKHFQAWMADLAMISALQKTSLRKLADHTMTPSLVKSAFALAFNAGIRNVHALVVADVARLLRIDGIGPKKLEAVESYLLEHTVKPHWTVAD